MNKKQTLSVVLATFNEEKNLAACLDNVKDIADEIVIVDGESSDKTVEIAKNFGAKIKITTNKPNFHINKQMAIDMATKDWVLQLDGDEHVSPELKDEILQILTKDQSPKTKDESPNGYWMPRKNLFLGRFLLKGGQYPDYTLRFYRNGKGRLPQKDVHEQAVVDGKVGYLKSALLHYPYKSFYHYLRKWNMYNNLFAAQIKEEQKNKNIFQKLFYAFAYLIAKPGHWFLTTYFRHKGFMDSWQGFTFSLFSALRFPASYIKYVGVYKLCSIVIILIAAIIRFWNFPTRWGLGGDDARDSIVALEAIRRHQLPLMGPFSSAGPFVFGGIYYWFIMFAYLVLPFFVYAPWILLEVLSVLTVGLLMYLGNLLKGKRFSIIIGILAAFSPQLVVRSLSLGPHTFIATFTTLTLIFFLLLWQTKKQIFSFLTGIFIGLALSFHYQAINLLIFFPALLFVFSLSIKQRLKAIFISVIGFLIPSSPLLYWDWHQGFANTRNILDYFLIGQYRLYVPNSWKLFLFKDIPSYWSFIVGNFGQVGFILFFSSVILFLIYFFKKKITGQFLVLGTIFFILIFLNRFYRGERSEGYLLYFLPFILIFTSFFLNEFFNFKNKIVRLSSILIILIIIVCNFYYIIKILNTKNTVDSMYKLSAYLSEQYPNTKFSIYDYKYKMYTSSTALSLIMGFEGKISNTGKKIGVSCNGNKCPSGIPIITEKILLIQDLENIKKADFDGNKKIWFNVNYPSVYDELIGWLNKNQLKSTFSLKNYLINK